MAVANILIVEDDADIREAVRILLESEQYAVTEAENGTMGLKLLNPDTDLVILDVMLGSGISGIQTCEQLRKQYNVPVLFLTAKSSESDKMLGLMVGGDDYLVKPFSYAELLGRVKALIRRYRIYSGKNEESAEKNPMITIGDISIHPEANYVLKAGRVVDLTTTEYKMLLLLMMYPQKIFSARNLYESVWEEPYYNTANGTIMVHIRKLRMKLEDRPEEPKHIKTIWGKGYQFE